MGAGDDRCGGAGHAAGLPERRPPPRPPRHDPRRAGRPRTQQDPGQRPQTLGAAAAAVTGLRCIYRPLQNIQGERSPVHRGGWRGRRWPQPRVGSGEVWVSAGRDLGGGGGAAVRGRGHDLAHRHLPPPPAGLQPRGPGEAARGAGGGQPRRSGPCSCPPAPLPEGGGQGGHEDDARGPGKHQVHINTRQLSEIIVAQQ